MWLRTFVAFIGGLLIIWRRCARMVRGVMEMSPRGRRSGVVTRVTWVASGLHPKRRLRYLAMSLGFWAMSAMPIQGQRLARPSAANGLLIVH